MPEHQHEIRHMLGPTRLLTMKQVCERVPYHRVYIYRLVKRGEFPKPVKMGERRNGWVESEVEEWIAERIAKRDNALELSGDGEVRQRDGGLGRPRRANG